MKVRKSDEAVLVIVKTLNILIRESADGMDAVVEVFPAPREHTPIHALKVAFTDGLCKFCEEKAPRDDDFCSDECHDKMFGRGT